MWHRWRSEGNKLMCLEVERALRVGGCGVVTSWRGSEIVVTQPAEDEPAPEATTYETKVMVAKHA